MKIFNLYMIFAVFSSHSVYSCIWTKASERYSSPFYPSNEIEVCFTEPDAAPKSGIENPTDDQYIREYQKSMNIIKRTVEKQINQRTNFNLHNFGYCSGSENSSGKIVIDLNSSEQIGALSKIGPEVLEEGDVSISMGIVKDVIRDKNNPSDVTLPASLREFSEKDYVSGIALHELLHTLGFQHEDSWDTNSFDSDVSEVIQVGDQMDEASVMNRGTSNIDGEGLSILSETDVQCLNLVASREIMKQPARIIDHSSDNRKGSIPLPLPNSKSILSQ